MEATIHKLIVSEEAKFDYAEMTNMLVGDFGDDLPPNFQIDTNIIEEVELYITNNRRVWYKHYLRLTYIDENTGTTYMLFILRKNYDETEYTQNWEVVGILESQYWDEDLEECGQIRAWYNTKINDLGKERDWVLEMYAYKILDKLEEIYEIGGKDGYIFARERVAEKLSKQQIDDRGCKEIEPRRLKNFLKHEYFSSSTANEIVRLLDRIIDFIREGDGCEGLEEWILLEQIC